MAVEVKVVVEGNAVEEWDYETVVMTLKNCESGVIVSVAGSEGVFSSSDLMKALKALEGMEYE